MAKFIAPRQVASRATGKPARAVHLRTPDSVVGKKKMTVPLHRGRILSGRGHKPAGLK